MRKIFKLGAIIAMCLWGTMSALAEDAQHKLAIHIDQNDPAVMNLVLNNVENVFNHFKSKGETVAIEVVAYGPGLNMLVAAQSPVKDRIAAMSLEEPGLRFSACGNTLAGMTKKAGHEIPLISEAVVVPAGVVRLMELDGDGYSYLKP